MGEAVQGGHGVGDTGVVGVQFPGMEVEDDRLPGSVVSSHSLPDETVGQKAGVEAAARWLSASPWCPRR